MIDQELLQRRTLTTSKNPFITTTHTADPSAHVWADGRIYVYASRDMDPPDGCGNMNHPHVYSSEDMVNWRDEGEILCTDDIPWGREEGGFLWAPDCAFKNGKYYYYYPHPTGDWNNTWKVGVAISEHPAKDFKDVGYIEGLGGFCMIDPCVFIDDDGRAYMYYGGGGMPEGGELAEDMVSLKDKMIHMEGLEDFHEASWVFKRNGIYYMTYSDNQLGSNRLCYAMSRNPLGPWEYKGVYLEPTGCDTSHGSVVEYKGQWYAFYHCSDVSLRGNLRSICVDPMEFNEDGTIRVVVQSRNGRLPVGPAPVPDPRTKVYSVKDAVTRGTCFLCNNEGAYQKRYVKGFCDSASRLEFYKVDGFEGQRVELGIYYGCGERLSRVRLEVNGKDLSFLNFRSTGARELFKGYAHFTLKLNPGEENVIKFVGGFGEVAIDAISVEPLD